MTLKGKSREELFEYSDPAPIDDADRLQLEDAQAAGTLDGRVPRWEVRLLASALEHPRRNGLLMSLLGWVLPVGTMAWGLVSGSYFPAVIPLGLAVTGAGLWLLVVPVPDGAAERLLGRLQGGGVRWIAWQLGMGGAILGGTALGIATLFWFDPV